MNSEYKPGTERLAKFRDRRWEGEGIKDDRHDVYGGKIWELVVELVVGAGTFSLLCPMPPTGSVVQGRTHLGRALRNLNFQCYISSFSRIRKFI
jgi:hypothetical protein